MRVYKEKNTNRWYVDYYLCGRRIRYPAGDSKRAANQLGSRITLEINAGEHDPLRTKSAVRGKSGGSFDFELLVAKFLREYLPRSGRSDYYVEQSKVWLRFFAGKRVANLASQDVAAMLRVRLKEVSQSTARKEVVSLGTFFRWAKRAGYMISNPADSDSVRRPAEAFNPREVHWLTDQELPGLKAACPAWLNTVVTWATETGMDRNKIRRLRWPELDLDRAHGRIVRGRFAMLRSKTGKPFRQELTEGAVEALNRAAKTRHTSGIVFLNEEGRPIEEKALEWALRKAYRETRITGCNFRTFRHTFATRALRRGVPREVLAKMMGHSTAFITERYMHVADDQLREAAKALSGPERIGGSNAAVQPHPSTRSAKTDTAAKLSID